MVINNEKLFIDILEDGFFIFNGEKLVVKVLRGLNGEIFIRDYFIYLGLIWDIFDGEYVIGRIYFVIK